MPRSGSYLPLSLVALVVVSIAALSLLTYRGVTQTRGLFDDEGTVIHTHAVREKLRDVLLDLTTVETAVRGFLLTDDEELLAPYHQARPLIEPQIEDLRKLTADNPTQQGRISKLQEQIETKLEGLDRVVRVNRDNGIEAARSLTRTGSGRRSMSDVRRIVAEMDAEEQNLQDARAQQTTTHFRRVVNNLIVSGVISSLLLLAIGLIVNVQLGHRARATEALRASEARYRVAASAAERANVLKDEFLAILSHELRTPLNAVLGWTQMLRSGSVQGPTVDRAVAAIDRNARAQQRLVEDLLDVSRIVAGKFDIERKPVHLATIVIAAVEAQRPVAAERGIELGTRITGSPIVNGDLQRGQQAIGNLLSNALKFTPRDGRVDVELSTNDREATLVVRDTGRGINADLLPFIFDRFRQGDSSTTRAHSGLGLGLAIVRHIVEVHGGSVRAASAGEGRGATFTVKWPVLDAGRGMDATAAAPAVAPPNGALDGIAILLVDDDEDSREMMAFALQQHGAVVKATASAAEALVVLDERRPDIVLTDLQMPDIDGFDLLRRVLARASRQGTPPVPMIAVTAHARAEDGASALATGFSAYLTKPINVARVIEVVRVSSRKSSGAGSSQSPAL